MIRIRRTEKIFVSCGIDTYRVIEEGRLFQYRRDPDRGASTKMETGSLNTRILEYNYGEEEEEERGCTYSG
jgi:hypothetical protein